MQTLHTPTAVWANDDHQQPDAVLIQQCLQDDDRAWAILLERYGSLIYSIAWRLRLSPEDVAEVFQSVCLALLKGLGTLKNESNLSAWLTTVTLQQCLRARQQPDPHSVATDQAGNEGALGFETAWLSDEAIRTLEQERLVRQAISMMPEPCRSLLTHILYEKDLWSSEEAAKELRQATSPLGADAECCLKKLMEVLDELGF